MPKSDLPVSIILVLFGAYVAFESYRMPRYESIGGTWLNAPGLVPGSLGLVIALLGGVMLVRYIIKSRQGPAAVAQEEPEPGTLAAVIQETADAEIAEKPSRARLLVTLALCITFAAGLVGTLPFWLAIFLFVFTFIVFFERAAFAKRSRAISMLLFAFGIAGAVSFAIPYLFTTVFLVTLP